MDFDEDRYRERLRRWAQEELPRYEIDGWKGPRRDGSGGGLIARGDEHEVHLATSAGVLHQRADGARVEVTSHRHDPDGVRGRTQHWAINVISRAFREPGASVGRQAQLEQERAALQDKAWRGELDCRSKVISVDGSSTVFEVFEVNDDLWAAFGRGPGVNITLESRGVLLGDIALVRAMGPPPPPRRPIRPPARTRAFPDEMISLPSGDLPPPQVVELIYRDDHLSGTVGADVFSLTLPRLKWAKQASLTGEIAGQPMVGEWSMVHRPSATGSDSYSAEVEGRYGTQPLRLQAELHFHDGHPFDHATVTGVIAGEAVQARIEPVNGGLPRSDSIAVDGSLGASELSIYLSVNHVPNQAIVRGHVSNIPIYINAVLRHSGGRHVTLAGSYQGSPHILVLALGSIVQFLR